MKELTFIWCYFWFIELVCFIVWTSKKIRVFFFYCLVLHIPSPVVRYFEAFFPASIYNCDAPLRSQSYNIQRLVKVKKSNDESVTTPNETNLDEDLNRKKNSYKWLLLQCMILRWPRGSEVWDKTTNNCHISSKQTKNKFVYKCSNH